MDSGLSELDLLIIDIEYISNPFTNPRTDRLQEIDKSKISGLIQSTQVLGDLCKTIIYDWKL